MKMLDQNVADIGGDDAPVCEPAALPYDYNWPDELQGANSFDMTYYVEPTREEQEAYQKWLELCDARDKYKRQIKLEITRFDLQYPNYNTLMSTFGLPPRPLTFGERAVSRERVAIQAREAEAVRLADLAAAEVARQGKLAAQTQADIATAAARERHNARVAECEPLPRGVFAALIYPLGVIDVRIKYQKAKRELDFYHAQIPPYQFHINRARASLDEIEAEIADTAKSLPILREFFESLGVTTIGNGRYGGEQDSALLVLGVFPDCVDRQRFGGLGERTGVYVEPLTVGSLRTVHAFLDSTSDVEMDFWEDGNEEWAGSYPWEAGTWRFRVSEGCALLPGADPASLIHALPKALLPYADVKSAGDAAGWNVDMTSGLLARKLRRDAPTGVPELVRGLLPRGQLVILAADGGEGKSSIAHQLAAAVSGAATSVLGYDIDTPGENGMAVLLLGEDNEVTVEARANGMESGGLDGQVYILEDRFGKDLAAALQHIESGMPPSLLVVDGADYWFPGNDKEKVDVNPFLQHLTDFARRTGACIVLIRHMVKPPKGPTGSLQSQKSRISGGPLWVNRARVAIVLDRDKRAGLSRLGVVKTNLAPQIQEHEIALRFDSATNLHHRTEAGRKATPAATPTPASPPVTDRSAVLVAAVARLRSEGLAVQRTGPNGLYKRKPAELVGWSRGDVEGVLALAIETGLLQSGKGGLVPVPAVPG
jgi:hypothetical protein